VTQEYAFRVIDPAMAPDRDDRYFPPKFELLIAGPIVGIIVGILGILGFSALAEDEKHRRLRVDSGKQ
jgi:uncharacterized protein involved in exopolysaccharide biosynthesis